VTFVDVGFFWFFPLVWLVHWALPRRATAQNVWLLAASWVFYASWTPSLLLLLLVSTCVDYAVGRSLARAAPARRRVLLWTSVAVNVGILAYCKYAGFFAAELAALGSAMGLSVSAATFGFVLPLGLSFYTLQKLGYILDVYDQRQPAEPSFVRFALFSGFFAQVVAGPISRAGQLLPQLAAPRRLRPEDLATGAWWFFVGYVLKGLVADRFGSMVLAGDGTWEGVVGPVFRFEDAYGFAAHWIALLGYAVQIFCDFAGYSLMAMGVARCFGLSLPLNFDRPYLSRSLPEFWRRWHITLNTWLFDYIYTPLCTGRGWFRGRVAACLMVVFVLSGLWHGGPLPFVLWGFLHGVGMVVHHRFDEFYKGLCRRDRVWVQRRKSRTWGLVSWGLTQAFFLLTLVPFKMGLEPAASEQGSRLERTWSYFCGLLPGGGARVDAGSVTNLAILALCAAIFVWHHAVVFGPGRWVCARFFALPGPVRGLAYGVGVAALVLLVPVGEGTFIYRNF